MTLKITIQSIFKKIPIKYLTILKDLSQQKDVLNCVFKKHFIPEKLV